MRTRKGTPLPPKYSSAPDEDDNGGDRAADEKENELACVGELGMRSPVQVPTSYLRFPSWTLPAVVPFPNLPALAEPNGGHVRVAAVTTCREGPDGRVGRG